MTLDDAITKFTGLSKEQQIRFLASFAHGLTVAARDTYEVGTERVVYPERLRELNEIQHRVIGGLLKLLDRDDARYPDDVLLRIITGEGDAGLLRIFESVLTRLPPATSSPAPTHRPHRRS